MTADDDLSLAASHTSEEEEGLYIIIIAVVPHGSPNQGGVFEDIIICPIRSTYIHTYPPFRTEDYEGGVPAAVRATHLDASAGLDMGQGSQQVFVGLDPEN